MEEKKYLLYVHTNKANDKKYVGITSKKAQQRWQNGFGYKSNKSFYKDIKKYGWNGFEHEILFTDLTEEEASEKEKEMIKLLKSNYYKNGYNHTAGGLEYVRGIPKFPKYNLVKESELLSSVFMGYVKRALGYEQITTTKYYEDDCLIKEETFKETIKPNVKAARFLLDNFKDEPRLQRLNYKLERVVKRFKDKKYVKIEEDSFTDFDELEKLFNKDW